MVRQFVNDDPSTYLTDPEQMERMLLSTIEAQERKNLEAKFLIGVLQEQELGATAAAVPGTGALCESKTSTFYKKVWGPYGKGATRSTMDRLVPELEWVAFALGPAMKLISGMFTPAGLLATEPLRIAQMRREGESWGEVAKSPTIMDGTCICTWHDKTSNCWNEEQSITR